jgi:hypothetical protein
MVGLCDSDYDSDGDGMRWDTCVIAVWMSNMAILIKTWDEIGYFTWPYDKTEARRFSIPYWGLQKPDGIVLYRSGFLSESAHFNESGADTVYFLGYVLTNGFRSAIWKGTHPSNRRPQISQFNSSHLDCQAALPREKRSTNLSTSKLRRAMRLPSTEHE